MFVCSFVLLVLYPSVTRGFSTINGLCLLNGGGGRFFCVRLTFHCLQWLRLCKHVKEHQYSVVLYILGIFGIFHASNLAVSWKRPNFVPFG